MFEGHTPEKKPVGPWAGIIIVVLLLVAGGFYFWGAQLNSQNETPQPFILGDEEGAPAGVPEQGSSDDAAALEAELNSFDLDQFDAQMQGDANAF
jgi:hypothetical protein